MGLSFGNLTQTMQNAGDRALRFALREAYSELNGLMMMKNLTRWVKNNEKTTPVIYETLVSL